MEIANIANPALKTLQCTICKDYLIHFPISVCSDGQTICGKCKLNDDQLSPCRSILLESIMKEATFVCKNKTNGCDHELSIEQAKEHEAKCVYRTVSCPDLQCDWIDLLIDMHLHFTNMHNVFYSDEASFTIDNKSNFISTCIIAIQDEFPFVFKYKYSPTTEVFSYNISYVSAYIANASYKIYKDDKEVTRGEIFPYVEDFTFNQFNTRNLLKSTITIKITMEQYPWSTVNNEVLQHLICSLCKGYLIPFAYNWCNSQLVCGSCARPDTTLTKLQIAETIKKTTFPCKWNGCTFVSTALTVFKHQKSCHFRVYCCTMCNYDANYKFYNVCKKDVFLEDIKLHLKISHSSTFITDPKSFTLSEKLSRFYGIKQGTVINVDIYMRKEERFIFFKSNRLGDIDIDYSAYVQFSHSHCRISSEWYHIADEHKLSYDDLPPCFTRPDVYITAIIKIV